jgi:hypothetical protein
MSAAPLPTRHYPQGHMETRMGSHASNPDWMRIGVGASLLTGSLLLLTGNKRAGLLVTAAGTALAMLDNKEIVAEWWDALPQYLDKAQHMIEQTQQTVDNLSAKRDAIRTLFKK